MSRVLSDLDFRKIEIEDLLLVESVRVHAKSSVISFVDIDSGALWQMTSHGFQKQQVAPELGFAEPLGSDAFLVGAGRRLGLVAPGSDTIWSPPLLPRGQRFNDATIDSLGRLIVGTLTVDPDQSRLDNRLFVLESDGTLASIRREVGLSNGIAVEPQSGDLFHVDTTSSTIHRIPLDPKSAEYGDPELMHQFANGESPDGLLMLETGELLVALWGSAALATLDITRGEIERVSVPPLFPTSVCICNRAGELILGSASQPRDSMRANAAPGALWKSTIELSQVPYFAWNPVPLRAISLGD